MEKIKTTASRLAVFCLVGIAVYLLCLVAYFIIEEPETLTWYENIMSVIVGVLVSEKICDMAFQQRGEDNV